MTDYGHDLLFGVFVTPTADPAGHAVDVAVAADRAGLDLACFQDHPYQPRFLDTWTLMAYVAARTERIRLSGDVLNLPLRPPAVLARAAASLDRLSGGRFELGLGAGAFWEAIEAMGGRRLAPGDSIDALEEAITVIRELWAVGSPGGVHVRGTHHRVDGAKRGPAPAHDVSVWIGGYKPRMLRLIGRVGDGVWPSLGFLPDGAAGLGPMNAEIDDAATQAGRRPADVRRLLNVSGRFAPSGSGLLDGPPEQWARDLAGLALEHGVSAFVLATDEIPVAERFAAEVAPATRELVAAARR